MILTAIRALRSLLCKLIGHRYRVTWRMNAGARQVECTRCGCVWGMHDATQSFIPWDGDLEWLYSEENRLHL